MGGVAASIGAPHLFYNGCLSCTTEKDLEHESDIENELVFRKFVIYPSKVCSQ